MRDINRKLDQYERRQKWIVVVTTLLVLLTFIPFILWLTVPNMGDITEVTGTVTRLIGLPSDEGEKLFLLVKLDKGDHVVRCYIANASFYRQGKKVVLNKIEPLTIGRPVYRFIRYIEPKPDIDPHFDP